MFGVQATVLKCGQIFSLLQIMFKTQVGGRVKVNRTNVN